MRIKGPDSGTGGPLGRVIQGISFGRWWAALFTVLIFGAGVAVHRAGLLEGTLDVVSRSTLEQGLRRVRGIFTNPERLVLDISHTDLMNLAHQRDVALERRVLLVSDEDFVNADVRHAGRTVPVRIRLKGDLVDHLEGGKWSFRVVARRDSTILGMKQFSLQHPQTKAFLYEKLYHEAMRREGLLALRYEFVDLTLNGTALGVYALEEHFEKRMVENNRRMEGPIVRFAEDVLWGQLALQGSVPPQQRGAVAGAGDYYSSAIDAFQTNRWMADSVARNQYFTAIQLLEAFRRGDVTTSDAFDIGQLATFFALSDMMSASHGVGNWSNVRFYYNPMTSRLEPIAFDAFDRGVPARPSLLALRALDENQTIGERRYLGAFLADADFYARYVAELERVSRPEYVDSLIADIGPDLQTSLAILHREFPSYEFSWHPIRRGAEFIRIALHPPRAVQAYLRSRGLGRLELDVANVQALPVRVIGLARDTVTYPTPPPLTLPGKAPGEPLRFEQMSFGVPSGFSWPDTLPAPLRVFYQTVGSDRVDEVEALPWPYDGLGMDALVASTPHRPRNVHEFEFIVIDEAERRIGIRPGSWLIDRDVIIPDGYRVFAGPGTRLDLTGGASILSRSAISFRGEPENPVIVESSDGTGGGLAVFQAAEESRLENVRFVGLANPRSEGWEVTGAVTFYESPVQILRSYFGSNRSEDGLHVMRTTFRLEAVTFQDALSDALDIDFARGSIVNAVFVNSGNDGLDASGSVVHIEGLEVRGAGDKGVSAGEGTELEARDVIVLLAAIGVASKDLSIIRMHDVLITRGQVGITAFRKKPEFGPGTIIITGLEMRDLELPYLIEHLSTVRIEGESIAADQDSVESQLYGATYGKNSG